MTCHLPEVVSHEISNRTVKPVLSSTQKEDQKLVFKTNYCLMQVKSIAECSPSAGQKYCRMLQGEHFAILSTFIKLPFAIKILFLSIFEWQLKTGFTEFGFLKQENKFKGWTMYISDLSLEKVSTLMKQLQWGLFTRLPTLGRDSRSSSSVLRKPMSTLLS